MPRSAFQYSSAELHSLRHACGTKHVDAHVFQTLKELNLLHLRSRRAGSHLHKHHRGEAHVSARTHRSTSRPVNQRNICPTVYPFKTQAKFCFINSQSLRNKTTEFIEFVLDNKLDIVAICETWLKTGDDIVIGDITPTGYTFKHFPRTNNKRGGGLALLYKSTLNVRFPESIANPKAFEVFSAEIVSSTLSLLLVVVYRPPTRSTGSSFDAFTAEFESLIEDVCLNQMPIIITGDFNVHVDSASNANACAFKNLLSSHNLRQSVTCPTHRKGHTLDLLITRESDPTFFDDLHVIDGIADHSAITIKLYLERPQNQKVEVKTRNVSAISKEALCDDIKSSKLSSTELKLNSLSSQAEQYNTILENIFDSHAPMKTRTVVLRPHSPWFKSSFHTEKRERRRLETLWRNSGLEIHRQMYTSQKQKVNRLIRQSKSTYYNDLFTENAKDQRRLFSIADKVLHRKSKSPLPQHQSKEQLSKEFCKVL
nr:uncharacterized protein LOC129273930 [Lytechinus pictus]